ncbi:MAG: hypothetical protein KA164_18545, partial [Rhodoferax sp.]|nr:hypothetical protein [Rhodoferax sp.]
SNGNAQASVDASGRLVLQGLDGNALVPLTVQVDDGTVQVERSFDLRVDNVVPTLQVTGAPTVVGGAPYVVGLAATDPGADTLSQWSVDWGDGTIDVLPGAATQASHVFAATGGAFNVLATATDEDTSTSASPLVVTVANDQLDVLTFTPDASGFSVRFDHTIDPTTIGLYNAAGQPADVSLVGDVTGTVRGSLVLDADLQGLRFIRSGGSLPADTYSVRLASGPAGFHGAVGALDGDHDGAPGDDFTDRFEVHPAVAGVLSLPDFMRGPGQAVDVPATAQWLPVTFNSAGGMHSMVFTVAYDPALLAITGAQAAAGLPVGSTVQFASETLGPDAERARVTVTLPPATVLAAGATRLVNLVASVPAGALYGSKQVLDVGIESFDGNSVQAGTVRADDALHVVGYFGDTSGSATYTTLDGQMVQRVIVNLDPGFAAWPNVDPLVVADVAGGGTLNSLDATRILQEVSYLTGASQVDRLELPAIPAGIGPVAFSGPDPVVDLPRDLRGAPGEVVTVPVRLDTAVGLESVQVRIGYDPAQFELVQVRRGALTGEFGWFVVGQSPGRINIDMSNLDALQGGTGTVLNVDLRIRPDAAHGEAWIDLQYARLNDGRLTLNTDPQVGPDINDGLVTVGAPVIDFGARVGAAAAPLPFVAGAASKPWLEDYLTRAGQAVVSSPNLAMRVTVPAGFASPMAVGTH